ncbi:hypothetical protein T484DRAFT_1789685 [Baffinella frigidus]|nr:hypothetical protein T484DRAFT_1789685 [Cryptophyta sp. CCMP2293]
MIFGRDSEESEEGAGGKLGGMFRVYIHPAPSASSSQSGASTAPLLVFQGDFDPETRAIALAAKNGPTTGDFDPETRAIALAAKNGPITVESLLQDMTLGSMHPKSHRGSLVVPVEQCKDLATAPPPGTKPSAWCKDLVAAPPPGTKPSAWVRRGPIMLEEGDPIKVKTPAVTKFRLE